MRFLRDGLKMKFKGWNLRSEEKEEEEAFVQFEVPVECISDFMYLCLKSERFSFLKAALESLPLEYYIPQPDLNELLFHACKLNAPEGAVSAILDRCTSGDIDRTYQSDTPLPKSVVEVVGAEPTFCTTPLQEAILNCNLPVVKLLLGAGASPHRNVLVCSRSGRTSVISDGYKLAAYVGDFNIIGVLYEHKNKSAK